jgi:hypothetical protein
MQLEIQSEANILIAILECSSFCLDEKNMVGMWCYRHVLYVGNPSFERLRESHIHNFRGPTYQKTPIFSNFNQKVNSKQKSKISVLLRISVPEKI